MVRSGVLRRNEVKKFRSENGWTYLFEYILDFEKAHLDTNAEKV